MSNILINREEATDQGLPKYFTGKPCPKGHICERYTLKSTCVMCSNEYSASTHGKSVRRKYNSSTVGRKKIRGYKQSPKGQITQRNWRQSVQGRLVDRRARLKYQYNLTIEQYNSMVVQQNNSCALCAKKFVFDDTLFRPVIDHNHITNKVRAILHDSCNLLVGIVENTGNKELSSLVNEYLEKYE